MTGQARGARLSVLPALSNRVTTVERMVFSPAADPPAVRARPRLKGSGPSLRELLVSDVPPPSRALPGRGTSGSCRLRRPTYSVPIWPTMSTTVLVWPAKDRMPVCGKLTTGQTSGSTSWAAARCSAARATCVWERPIALSVLARKSRRLIMAYPSKRSCSRRLVRCASNAHVERPRRAEASQRSAPTGG